jgi:hypothetical protein
VTVTTLIDWYSSDILPSHDDYYLVYSISFPIFLQTMHYDSFLNRWTSMDDDSIFTKKEFFWANIPSKSSFYPVL